MKRLIAIALSLFLAGNSYAASYTFLAHASVPSENNTGWTTGTLSAPANSLLIVGSAANTEGGGSSQSVSASGLTFVEVDHYLNNSNEDVYLWYAVVGGGGFSGTVSVTPSTYQYSFTGQVGYFDTPDTGSPLVQSAKAALTHTDVPPIAWSATNTFTSPTTTGNLSFAYWAYFDSGAAPATTARSGWTEADSVFASFNGTHGSEVQSYFTSDTDAGITYASSFQGSTRHAWVIQAEFATSGGGGGATATSETLPLMGD